MASWPNAGSASAVRARNGVDKRSFIRRLVKVYTEFGERAGGNPTMVRRLLPPASFRLSAGDPGSFVNSRAGSSPPEDAARELIVLELYREGRVSGGKAAELLGITLETFLKRAGDLGIPCFDMPDDEWAREKDAVDATVHSRVGDSSALIALCSIGRIIERGRW